MVYNYTFPNVTVEIMLALLAGPKSPESIAEESSRNMLSILSSLEELMSNNILYKLPDSTFTLTKVGRSFIEELNSVVDIETTVRGDIFDLRW